MATPKPINKQNKYSRALENIFSNAEVDLKILEAKENEDFIKIPKDFNQVQLIKNDKNQEFLILPLKSFQTLLGAIKDFEEEKFFFELEKEITKEMPIDFDDVWCIAIKEYDKSQNKDFKALVKSIKKQYPYLFFEMNSFLNSLKKDNA